MAQELGMSENDLVKKIEKNSKSGYLYLARQVESNKADYIRKLKIKGINLETEHRRFLSPRRRSCACGGLYRY